MVIISPTCFWETARTQGVFAVDGFAFDGDDEIAADAEFNIADIDYLCGALDASGFFRRNR